MRNELEKYITDDKKRFTFSGIIKKIFNKSTLV